MASGGRCRRRSRRKQPKQEPAAKRPSDEVELIWHNPDTFRLYAGIACRLDSEGHKARATVPSRDVMTASLQVGFLAWRIAVMACHRALPTNRTLLAKRCRQECSCSNAKGKS